MSDRTGLFQRALANPHETLRELERIDCEDSLVTFLEHGWRYIDGHPYQPGWHLEAVAEHLEAVTRGQIRRLVINIPPRMTKSSLVSVAWPAWTWAQRPGDEGGMASSVSPLSGPHVQFLSASYANSLSLRDSVKHRRLVQSPWYQELWGDRYYLAGDQNAKQRFDNSAGGYRLSTSVTGALTGEGGDIIVVDDPHNTVEIESEAMRDEVIRWWDESISTRLNNLRTGAYVIVMQRLYDNDLTGHVLSQSAGDWVHLMLPMEYDPRRHCTTSIGFEDPRTEDGELLCEERVGPAELAVLKKTLGPFGSAGQLQQSPVPRGGGIILEDYWQAWPPHVSELADEFGRPLKPIAYPEMDFILVSVDTAMTEKEENDWTACVVLGVWSDRRGLPKIMLMEAWQERLAFHQLVQKIMSTCTKRSADRLIIEGKNNGFSVEQEIRRLCRGAWGVQLVPVKGDKVARTTSVQPIFAAEQVWAPARNINGDVVFMKWAQMVIDQFSSFPRGEHDDLVDAMVHGIRHLRDGLMLQTTEERQEERRIQRRPRGKREPLYGIMA